MISWFPCLVMATVTCCHTLAAELELSIPANIPTPDVRLYDLRKKRMIRAGLWDESTRILRVRNLAPGKYRVALESASPGFARTRYYTMDVALPKGGHVRAAIEYSPYKVTLRLRVKGLRLPTLPGNDEIIVAKIARAAQSARPFDYEVFVFLRKGEEEVYECITNLESGFFRMMIIDPAKPEAQGALCLPIEVRGNDDVFHQGFSLSVDSGR